jgi:hypothetical protein
MASTCIRAPLYSAFVAAGPQEARPVEIRRAVQAWRYRTDERHLNTLSRGDERRDRQIAGITLLEREVVGKRVQTTLRRLARADAC